MLVASRRTITFTGNVDARGGGDTAGGGSMRLVADELAGNGWIDCYGLRGNAVGSTWGGGFVRLEANRLLGAPRSRPDTVVVPPANPPVIWPAATAPTARIVSVGGVDTKPDPRAPIAPSPEGPDAQIQSLDQVRILIETRNFNPVPQARVVLGIDSNLAPRKDITATLVEGGTFALAQWEVVTTLPPGYSTMIVNAVGP